jgi:hypothetical protein
MGRSFALMRYFALPGTRLVLASDVRADKFRLRGSLDRTRTSFGETKGQRVGVTFDGISLTLVDRASRTNADQRRSLLQNQTDSHGIYADFDLNSVRDELLPQSAKLGALMPVSFSINLQSARSRTEVPGLSQSYKRSSFEATAGWETPLGDTDVDYMSQRRIGLTGGVQGRTDQYLQLSHSVRWHDWQFGADAMLSTGSSVGARGSKDKTLSWGGSVSYFVADGPEFSLQVGQDKIASQLNDDSYLSTERYSSITGSLDLSRYLQRRFGRKDLHLRLDYRRALNVDNSSLSTFGEAVQRLIDRYDRSGLLVSFSMNL